MLKKYISFLCLASVSWTAFLNPCSLMAAPHKLDTFNSINDDYTAFCMVRSCLNYEKLWKTISCSAKIPNSSNDHDLMLDIQNNICTRNLADYAFTLCEADLFFRKNHTKNENPILSLPLKKIPLERCDTLFQLLRLAQNKDDSPNNPVLGNFTWYCGQDHVEDRNAVEFITLRLIPIWINSRMYLHEKTRNTLHEILQNAAIGCLRHKVSPAYTNIAIMNAVNLILLGEQLSIPNIRSEGVKRLQSILYWTWQFGFSEFVSPTYYGVNMNALALAVQFIKNDGDKNSCRALLDLLWLDIAVNWFQPAKRLAGAHSRSYNYLFAQDESLNAHLRSAHLLPPDKKPGVLTLAALKNFSCPQSKFLTLNSKYPRSIKQIWGPDPNQWRSSYICNDIALGISCAEYPARQDALLAVDLPEKNHPNPRCYFIPDGRNDPYGLVRIPMHDGHKKALHLLCSWIAVQHEHDVLAAAIYKPEHLNLPYVTNVSSHFILLKPDALRVGNTWFNPSEFPVLKPNISAVVCKYGSALLAIRLLWARAEDGHAPSFILTDDSTNLDKSDPDFNVLRLTIPHHTTRKTHSPGLCLWVRTASNIHPNDLDLWADNFLNAKPLQLLVQGDDFYFSVPAKNTNLKIARFGKLSFTNPKKPDDILTLNDSPLGKKHLENHVPALKFLKQRCSTLQPISIQGNSTTWNASVGIYSDDMIVPDPLDPNRKVLEISGNASWTLDVQNQGTYYLWARVLAADPTKNSVALTFHLENASSTPPLYPQDWPPLYDNILHVPNWSLEVSNHWKWTLLKIHRIPSPLYLPKGKVSLNIQPREPGVLLDQLILSTSPEFPFSENPKLPYISSPTQP